MSKRPDRSRIITRRGVVTLGGPIAGTGMGVRAVLHRPGKSLGPQKLLGRALLKVIQGGRPLQKRRTPCGGDTKRLSMPWVRPGWARVAVAAVREPVKSTLHMYIRHTRALAARRRLHLPTCLNDRMQSTRRSYRPTCRKLCPGWHHTTEDR